MTKPTPPPSDRFTYIDDDETDPRRRRYDSGKRDGWTWTKEILGTAIAVVGVMAVPSGWLFSTLQGVILAQAELRGVQAMQAVELAHLKESNSATVVRGEKIDGKLDRILDQIADIKIEAAKRAATGKP